MACASGRTGIKGLTACCGAHFLRARDIIAPWSAQIAGMPLKLSAVQVLNMKVQEISGMLEKTAGRLSATLTIHGSSWTQHVPHRTSIVQELNMKSQEILGMLKEAAGMRMYTRRRSGSGHIRLTIRHPLRRCSA